MSTQAKWNAPFSKIGPGLVLFEQWLKLNKVLPSSLKKKLFWFGAVVECVLFFFRERSRWQARHLNSWFCGGTWSWTLPCSVVLSRKETFTSRPTGTTESDGQKIAYGSLKKAIICSAVAHQQTFFFFFFPAKPSATQSLTTYCRSTVFSFCFVFFLSFFKFAKWKSHRLVQTQALHSKTRCISPHPVNDQQKTLNKWKWGKEIKNEGQTSTKRKRFRSVYAHVKLVLLHSALSNSRELDGGGTLTTQSVFAHQERRLIVPMGTKTSSKWNAHFPRAPGWIFGEAFHQRYLGTAPGSLTIPGFHFY